MVNVLHRINARKIVLSYFYEHSFFCKEWRWKKIVDEMLFMDNIFPTDKEIYEEAKEKFFKVADSYDKWDDDENLDYYINVLFSNWNKEDIDLDYVFKVGKNFSKYRDELIEKVNKYANSFTYDQMSFINQSLFLLWYVERKELETPKNILINEMIELSKRYGDDWWAKLINGIMDKIFVTEVVS